MGGMGQKQSFPSRLREGLGEGMSLRSPYRSSPDPSRKREEGNHRKAPQAAHCTAPPPMIKGAP